MIVEYSILLIGFICLLVYMSKKNKEQTEIVKVKRSKHKYTESELELLKSDKTDKELAELLKLSTSAIYNKRRRINS